MTLFRSLVLASLGVSSVALGATGVCDANAGAPAACSAALSAGGVVVNDVFKDSNGLGATQLRTAVPFDVFANCDNQVATTGCEGMDQAPYDCPGSFVCGGVTAGDFPQVFSSALSVDRVWWQTCRLASTALDANGCPSSACIQDGTGGNYAPWLGLAFDLTSHANAVAIFAANDHGPVPCESVEVTVFLTDNPASRDVVIDPKTAGVDPQKWNRATLTKVFTQGWTQTRAADPAGHAACGDTASYSVEEDAFATVFSLPAGQALRYAAVVAGNDGLDFPQCGYDSSDAEIDAVAGLTESGANVCPDSDNDGAVDCNCPGAPPACDCNDGDPTLHPGATEACDSTSDLNCDGTIGGCAMGETCVQSVCVGPDAGESMDAGSDGGSVSPDAGTSDAGTGGGTPTTGCGCDGSGSTAAAFSFAAWVALAAAASRRRARN